MAETVSGSTAVMTITPRFLFFFFFPQPKAVNSMQFTTFTHLSKVPPHEYGGSKISFRRQNENSETTKTEARWGGGETGLESHISTTALRLQHKLLFISIPAACQNYLSPLEGSPRGVSPRRNPRKGEGPGRQEAQPGRIKNLL